MAAQKELTRSPAYLLTFCTENLQYPDSPSQGLDFEVMVLCSETFFKETDNQRFTINRKSTHISEMLRDEEQDCVMSLPGDTNSQVSCRHFLHYHNLHVSQIRKFSWMRPTF